MAGGVLSSLSGKKEARVDYKQRTWLKVPEVAAELGIPRTRAYELIQRGQIPAVRVGERSIRVNRQELEQFLLSQRVVAGR
jgi:excisionase family DNA binding protein